MYKADSTYDEAWKQALVYFRSRKSVLFVSYCRFWERHGFVQQSLAMALAREGVEVVWLDGSGWRTYDPVVACPHPNLKVVQLPALPLRRLPFVSQADLRAKAVYLGHLVKKLGGNPLIWVEGGIDEALVDKLPYVDVFSVFDDPYRHSPQGKLCRRAKALIAQNKTAFNILASAYPEKSHLLLPPVDMGDEAMQLSAQAFLPAGFPDKVMGYVGSFFSDGFDLDLFESFMMAYPDWGFVLMGRTDNEGLLRISDWKTYKNFHYFPWVPRNQVASVWKLLKVTLLFYKANRTQDGAFPVKIVESLRFGVPCIATEVPKTADLEGVFPRSNSLPELKASVEKVLSLPKGKIEELYQKFVSEMDPMHHLAQVASWLQN